MTLDRNAVKEMIRGLIRLAVDERREGEREMKDHRSAYGPIWVGCRNRYRAYLSSAKVVAMNARLRGVL